MTEKILITGGCGFIGANLIPLLEKKNYKVRVLDNLSRGQQELLSDTSAEIIIADIRDRDAIKNAMEDITMVIHLAAYGSVVESTSDIITNFEINARGTLNMLDAAYTNGVKKFIFASTGGAIVGDAEPPVNELSPSRPKSPYGASKMTGEAYCFAYSGTFKLPTVILRFANIYGPNSAHKTSATTVFCKALLAKKPITIFGDGSASRDFLYVEDLCNGIILALEKDVSPGTVLHLATANETTVKEFVNILLQVSGQLNHPVEYLPARPGEILRNFASFERAAELLGFKPITSIEEGLRKTWNWYASQCK